MEATDAEGKVARRCSAAFWTGEDLLDGVPTKTSTIIFRTRGCYWGLRVHVTCRIHRRRSIEPADARRPAGAIQSVSRRIDHGHRQIFTSGSFFDPGEVPEPVRDKILSQLNLYADKIIVETRPEFVTDKVLAGAMMQSDKLEVAIGPSDIERRHTYQQHQQLLVQFRPGQRDG